MKTLSEQELHNLAMNTVGEELKKKGWEFLAVNSQLKRDPQFVCIDKGNIKQFVIVRAISYPDDPRQVDWIFMETIKQHALKFNAKTHYAGVGIANAADYEKPVTSDADYVINFPGLIEI